MKKTLFIVLAVLVSIAFVTNVFAASTTQTATDKAAKAAADAAKDKAKTATDKSAPATEKKTEKREAKPKTHQFTGDVAVVDMTAKTLSAKKQKEEKAFDIANVKMKAEPKVGDKVLVKYIEKDGKNIASSVTVTKKAPAKKEEVKKEAPKAAAPATPVKAAPATPAAPAAPAKK